MKNRSFLGIVLIYFIYALLALVALRVLLVLPGVIGLRNDWGIPPYAEQLSRMLTDPLYVWYQIDLGHSIFIQSGAILGVLFGFFGFIGVNGEIFSKILVVFVLSIAGFTMFLLLRKLSKNVISQFIAGLFYLFNPFVYNLFSNGSVQELVAYALSPLVVLMFLKAVGTDKLKGNCVIATALLFVLVGAAQQYVVMIFILFLGFVLFKLGCKNRKEGLKLLLILPIIWLSLNSWWILPFLGTIGSQVAVIGNVASTMFITNIAPVSSILDIAQLAGAPNFFIPSLLESNVFVLSIFQLTSITLVLIAFSTLLFRKDKVTIFFASIAAIITIFISSPTFVTIYNSFFLAKLFRNTSHLYFLVAFSYSILLEIAFESFLANRHNLQQPLKIPCNFLLKLKRCLPKNFVKASFAFVIIILILVNSSPFFMGNLGSTVHNFSLPSEYKQTYDWLSSQSGEFRVVWQPDVTPIVYSPAVEGLSGFYSGGGVDAYIGYSPKPTYGNYFPSDFSQFVEVSLHQAPTKDFAYLLSAINAKYVIIRQDYETLAPTWGYMGGYPELQKQWNNEYIINKLTNQNGIALYKRTGNITILENKLVTPWITSVAPENTFVILGDANAFFVLPSLPDFPANNSILIFPSQYSSEQPLPSSVSNIIILDYDTFDLVQAYIPLKYKIDPGSYAGGIDATTDWVSLSRNQIYTWWWYNYRYTASLDAAALTLTNSSLTIPYDVVEDGTYDLWGKLFFGTKATALTLYIDGKQETTINVSSTEMEGFFWEHLTQLNLTRGRHIVTINSNKGENVIAKMVITPQPVLDTAIKNAASFLDNKSILVIDQNWNSYLQSIPYSSINIFQNVAGKVQNAKFTYFLNHPPQIWTNSSPTETPSETSATIFTPCPGNYLLAIKVETGYGYGNLLTKIDNQTFIIDANTHEQGPFVTYKYIGPVNLTAGHHTISTSGENTIIPVYNGQTNSINWISTFTNQNYAARYYPDWKAVVRTDGSDPWDTLSFPIKDQSPYIFPLFSPTDWNALNSTLVYLVTDDKPLRIDEIQTDGTTASDIAGVWWETDWIGMNTKPITFPIIIPPNQKAIIQINHKANTITLKTNPPQIETMLLYSLKNGETFADANNLLSTNQTDNPSITYEKINLTKYTVHVNASKPFYLVFSESFHKDWIAYIDGQPIPDECHFMANGYANGWYINKTGNYTITLEFWPQNLFYAGSAISVTTLILCTLYISKNKIKTTYKKFIKKK